MRFETKAKEWDEIKKRGFKHSNPPSCASGALPHPAANLRPAPSLLHVQNRNSSKRSALWQTHVSFMSGAEGC